MQQIQSYSHTIQVPRVDWYHEQVRFLLSVGSGCSAVVAFLLSFLRFFLCWLTKSLKWYSQAPTSIDTSYLHEAEMGPQRPMPGTTGASSFDPDALFGAWRDGQKFLPVEDNFRSSILTAFDLPQNDNYIYHAIASVTLAQVQKAVEHGGKNGLHAWYLDGDGQPV